MCQENPARTDALQKAERDVLECMDCSGESVSIGVSRDVRFQIELMVGHPVVAKHAGLRPSEHVSAGRHTAASGCGFHEMSCAFQ